MLKAKEIKATPIHAKEFTEGTLTFDTVDELAKHLKVEVITEKPELETPSEDAPKEA